MPDRSLVERIASGEERPCVQMSAPELMRHAQTNWDEVFCLYQVVAEARIRVRKNPKSRAKRVLEEVGPRLELMCGATFPDDPNPEPDADFFLETPIVCLWHKTDQPGRSREVRSLG
jgi:hypothetical protein